jgi:quinol monooxygenase YgiN
MGMVVVSGVVDMAPGTREAALAGAQALVEGARAQQGCVSYVWSADPHAADRVHVFEEWTDGAHLAAHLKGPWYSGMIQHLSGFGITGAVTRKYRVDLAEPVYDPTGTPRADFFTG